MSFFSTDLSTFNKYRDIHSLDRTLVSSSSLMTPIGTNPILVIRFGAPCGATENSTEHLTFYTWETQKETLGTTSLSILVVFSVTLARRDRRVSDPFCFHRDRHHLVFTHIIDTCNSADRSLYLISSHILDDTCFGPRSIRRDLRQDALSLLIFSSSWRHLENIVSSKMRLLDFTFRLKRLILFRRNSHHTRRALL